MSVPNTWKSVEAKIANYFGGQRRGADFRNRFRTGGKNDVTGADGWSIEIKHSSNPTYSLMAKALQQATSAKESDDEIPIVVVHPKGWDYDKSIVVIDAQTYVDRWGEPQHYLYSAKRIKFSEMISYMAHALKNFGDNGVLIIRSSDDDPLVLQRLDKFVEFHVS